MNPPQHSCNQRRKGETTAKSGGGEQDEEGEKADEEAATTEVAENLCKEEQGGGELGHAAAGRESPPPPPLQPAAFDDLFSGRALLNKCSTPFLPLLPLLLPVRQQSLLAFSVLAFALAICLVVYFFSS